jgi:pimeloyl-ACP methyl ester carboxylesterase
MRSRRRGAGSSRSSIPSVSATALAPTSYATKSLVATGLQFRRRPDHRVIASGRSAAHALSVHSHTIEDTARHLRATLAAAGEEPPFIVVGHSLGGVYARVFASSFRPEVSGVVLVDPYLPDIRPVEHVALDPALREEWLSGLRATNDRVAAVEDLDWAASYDQLSRASVEGLPLELLFVDQRFRWEGRFEPAKGDLIAAWRRLLGRLSAEYRLTIAEDSTHLIQYDRPVLVVDAILRLANR